MKVKKKELIDALGKAKLFTGHSFAILEHVLIDGPGGKIIATDTTTTAEIVVNFTDYTRMVEGERPDNPVPDEKLSADMMGLKKEQLENLAEYAGVDATGTKNDIVDRIMEASQESFERKEAEPLPMVEVEERFCVDPVQLLKIVKSLDLKGEDFVTLDVEEFVYREDILETAQACTLGVGEHFQKLIVAPMSDFPATFLEIEENPINRPFAMITGEALESVVVAIDNKPSEPKVYLKNILFDSENQNIVATDGSRLHVFHQEMAKVYEKILLSAWVMKQVGKIASTDIEVKLDAGNENIKLTFGNVVIYTKNAEGAYPDYMDLVSSEANHTIQVEKSAISRALNQAALVSDIGMKLTFNGGINVESYGESGQYNRENVPFLDGKVDPPVEMNLNPAFLLDALKYMGEKVEIKFKDEILPISFRNDAFQALIMPCSV